MSKAIVNVNSHKIKSNEKNGNYDPPITIRRGKKIEYANSVRLIGNVRIVYNPDKPLNCGARVWIEADDAIAEPI